MTILDLGGLNAKRPGFMALIEAYRHGNLIHALAQTEAGSRRVQSLEGALR